MAEDWFDFNILTPILLEQLLLVSNGRKDRDVTADYFSLLDQEDVRKLYELYRNIDAQLPGLPDHLYSP